MLAAPAQFDDAELRAVPPGEPGEHGPLDDAGDGQDAEALQHDAHDLLAELPRGERLAEEPEEEVAVHAGD